MAPKRTPIGERTAPQPISARPSPAADALMGAEYARREVVDLQVRVIMPNRFQPRTQRNEERLQELAESIRQHGVLEPVIVRPIPLTPYEGTGRQYELIAGERRWLACSLANIATIPALILEDTTDDQTMLELAITENLQREDLHPLDEALAFGRMQRELNYSYAQIAERLGKSKGYVQNRLRLLSLDEELQQLVLDRPDTLGHVYELARLSDLEARRVLIDAVRDDALSRAETRTRVQALLAQNAPPAPAPDAAPAAEPYFQKYDHPANVHDESAPTGSFFQKYERSTPHPEPAPAGLTAAERSSLHALTTKLDELIVQGHTLHERDWTLLEGLAERLRKLLEDRD